MVDAEGTQRDSQTRESLEKIGNCASFACCALPLGKWWGVRVRISVLYFVFWGVVGLCCGFYESKEAAALWATVFGPLLTLTIVGHELGHAVTTNRLGGKATDILLWPLGGVSVLDHDKGPMVDFWITIAGPLTHIPQAIFWLAQSPLAKMVGHCPWHALLPQQCTGTFWEIYWFKIVYFGVLFNMFLLAANLLIPLYPLDGGRAVLDIFLAKGCTPRMAAVGCVCVSVPMAITLAVLMAVYLHDWLSFVLALLLLIPNFSMIYLIAKNELDLHPSFRNLNITRDDLDRPLMAENKGTVSESPAIV